MTVGPDVNYEELARSTDEFNAAQLKAVCVEAGMIALREGATKLTHEHFLSGIAEGMFRSFDVCYATDVIIADTQCKQRRRMTLCILLRLAPHRIVLSLSFLLDSVVHMQYFLHSIRHIGTPVQGCYISHVMGKGQCACFQKVLTNSSLTTGLTHCLLQSRTRGH